MQDLEFREEWLTSHYRTEKDVKVDSEGDEYIQNKDVDGHIYKIYLPLGARKNHEKK